MRSHNHWTTSDLEVPPANLQERKKKKKNPWKISFLTTLSPHMKSLLSILIPHPVSCSLKAVLSFFRSGEISERAAKTFISQHSYYDELSFWLYSYCDYRENGHVLSLLLERLLEARLVCL